MTSIIIYDSEDELQFEGDDDIQFQIYRLRSEKDLPEINYQHFDRSLLDLCDIEQIPDQELNFSDFAIPSPFPPSFNQRKSVLNTIALSTSQNHLKTPDRFLSDFSEGMASSPKSLIEESDVSEDRIPSTLNSLLQESTSHKSKDAVSSPPINQLEIQNEFSRKYTKLFESDDFGQ